MGILCGEGNVPPALVFLGGPPLPQAAHAVNKVGAALRLTASYACGLQDERRSAAFLGLG